MLPVFWDELSIRNETIRSKESIDKLNEEIRVKAEEIATLRKNEGLLNEQNKQKIDAFKERCDKLQNENMILLYGS